MGLFKNGPLKFSGIGIAMALADKKKPKKKPAGTTPGMAATGVDGMVTPEVDEGGDYSASFKERAKQYANEDSLRSKRR